MLLSKPSLMKAYRRNPEALQAYMELSERDQLIIDRCVRDLVSKVGNGLGPSSAFKLLHTLGIHFQTNNFRKRLT